MNEVDSKLTTSDESTKLQEVEWRKNIEEEKERVSKLVRFNEWMKQWMNETMNEWKNEWNNEWILNE